LPSSACYLYLHPFRYWMNKWGFHRLCPHQGSLMFNCCDGLSVFPQSACVGRLIPQCGSIGRWGLVAGDLVMGRVLMKDEWVSHRHRSTIAQIQNLFSLTLVATCPYNIWAARGPH
jgi:hypothetical protein